MKKEYYELGVSGIILESKPKETCPELHAKLREEAVAQAVADYEFNRKNDKSFVASRVDWCCPDCDQRAFVMWPTYQPLCDAENELFINSIKALIKNYSNEEKQNLAEKIVNGWFSHD